MGSTAGDYVLGTHDAELERLGLQHRVWRDITFDAWRRAGIGAGARVLDVGAGPGYATLDLAEAVGPAGRVIAIERSPRFVKALREECRRRGLAHVEVIEADLMDAARTLAVRDGSFDCAWCRWVASFVASPATLADVMRDAVRPGGRIVLHEYADYGTWQIVPPRPALRQFVVEVMASWRAQGGEANIAPALVGLLRERGFAPVAMRPLVFLAAPGEPLWRWPASFVASNLARLQELGRISAAWAEAVRADLASAEADAGARMVTPLVLEVIAERDAGTAA